MRPLSPRPSVLKEGPLSRRCLRLLLGHLADVEITGSAKGDKPIDSRIAKTAAPGATTSKCSTGKAPGFQSYKDLALTALFGELHRRVGESRQAEDNVLAELQEKFEVHIYIYPSPQVPGCQPAMTRDFQYDLLDKCSSS